MPMPAELVSWARDQCSHTGHHSQKGFNTLWPPSGNLCLSKIWWDKGACALSLEYQIIRGPNSSHLLQVGSQPHVTHFLGTLDRACPPPPCPHPMSLSAPTGTRSRISECINLYSLQQYMSMCPQLF